MASVIDSVEVNPFDHFIEIGIAITGYHFGRQSRCIAIDRLTDQIYVIFGKVDLDFKQMWDLLIYSQSGEFLRSFLYERKMEAIYGMAIHKNNVYIVSELSCFHHFEVADSMNLIGCKNDRGSGIGKFKQPRQLDISNEGDLFVADFGNNRVQILDGRLQYKRHISHDSMLKPFDVKLTPDEVYVLGDSPKQLNFCIHMFTHMGEKLSSVFLNDIPKRMQYPGFCVDTCGNVIIIDNGTQQIKFFTKEGNLFETMDTLRISNMSIRLMGIAWMNKHKLVVISGVQSHYYCLEMYS